MKLNRHSCSRAGVLLIFTTIVGCSLSYSGSEFRSAQKDQSKKNYSAAIKRYSRIVRRSPDSDVALKSAREAARLALFETKDFTTAIEFYNHIVQYTATDRERREAQRAIAKIYFEKLANYEKAIEVFNKLLMLRNSNDEVVDYRFDLARAEFYLNHFAEAQTEIEQALKIVENKDKKFELLMFLGNIHFNTKKTETAISTYEEVMRLYPERAQKDNVAMNIVVCYEDAEIFDKAIERLESMRASYPDPEFIDLKIKRMRTRKSNLPGSRGLRK